MRQARCSGSTVEPPVRQLAGQVSRILRTYLELRDVVVAVRFRTVYCVEYGK